MDTKVLYLSAFIVTVIALSVIMVVRPLNRLVFEEDIMKDAFIARVDGDRLTILFSGRLNAGEVRLKSVDAGKLEVVFISEGNTVTRRFSGELRPFEEVSAEIPEGARSYIIYYDGKRLRGGVLG